MKKIAWVTTARSEFNASRYVIKVINDDPEFELQLLVGGTHWEDKTFTEIEKNYSIYPAGSFCADTPKVACYSLSNEIKATIDYYLNFYRPDLFVLNGDRIELMPYVLAAVLYKIPICHIGGGDLTDGSDDNQTRYAISRYSHLHLVSCQESANNLIQSGEEPWRVKIVGQCGLENIMRTEKLSLEETSRKIGLDLSKPTALCIYYPAREPDINVENQIRVILHALDESKIQTIFIYPCAEIGSDIIRSFIDYYCKTHDNCKAFPHLENQLFQSALWYSRFMIGNSSAGVIEAPFINRLSINIGNRQKGRRYPSTVIDVNCSEDEIIKKITWILRTGRFNYFNSINIDFPSQKIIQAIKDNIDRPDLLYKKILLGDNK